MANNRSMVFVDGTNLLSRLSSVLDVKFSALKPPGTALNLAMNLVVERSGMGQLAEPNRIRNHWFASYRGDEEDRTRYARLLDGKGIQAHLFKAKKGGREKGVDIALAVEMLVNAFNQNYDLGMLVAGDEDYRMLVQEVKRYGPRVGLAFFENGLSDELRQECDYFIRLDRQDPKSIKRWEEARAPILEQIERDKNRTD